MKKSITIISCLALITFFALASNEKVADNSANLLNNEKVDIQKSEDGCFHTDTEFRCVKFVKNHDGDTITVDIKNVHPIIGNKISVRVFGVDTAELTSKNECEKQAARIAKNLVNKHLKEAKVINLKNIQKDKYFRILADVEYDGIDLKSVLLKNNLAYEYYGQSKLKKDWCKVINSK